MSADKIKHYLVIYDIPAGHAEVERFGDDYKAAVAAYNHAEREHKDDGNVEVVLLGSDSLATLERTHSSYFSLSEKHADQVVARILDELALR